MELLKTVAEFLTVPPSLPKSSFPRPSPQGPPEARPSPILRRLSRPLFAALHRAARHAGEASVAREEV